MKNTCFILLLFMAVFACKSQKSVHTASHAPFVGLQTSGCFGYCPVFKLTVLGGGLVRYEGERFVEKEGRDSFMLTKEELVRLRAKVASVNLWQYPDRIESQIMDAPSATLFAYDSAKTKRVSGSIDRPVPLLELENMLKDLAEAHGLQVKRGVDPRAVPADAKKELILKLKPELNAGNWIAQFTEFRVQLVRRISSENIWLVGYDSKQIDEKTIIELFKNTEGVVEVQANAKVEDRN